MRSPTWEEVRMVRQYFTGVVELGEETLVTDCSIPEMRDLTPEDIIELANMIKGGQDV